MQQPERRKAVQDIAQIQQYLLMGGNMAEDGAYINQIVALQDELLNQNDLLINHIKSGLAEPLQQRMVSGLSEARLQRQSVELPHLQVINNEQYAGAQLQQLTQLLGDDVSQSLITRSSMESVDNLIFEYFNQIGTGATGVEDVLDKVQGEGNQLNQLYTKYQELYPDYKAASLISDKYDLIQSHLQSAAKIHALESFVFVNGVNETNYNPKSQAPQQMMEYAMGIQMRNDDGEDFNFLEKANKNLYRFDKTSTLVEEANKIDKEMEFNPEYIWEMNNMRNDLEYVSKKYKFRSEKERELHANLTVARNLAAGVLNPIKDTADIGSTIVAMYTDESKKFFDVLQLTHSALDYIKQHSSLIDNSTLDQYRKEKNINPPALINNDFWYEHIMPLVTLGNKCFEDFAPAMEGYKKIIPTLINQQDLYKMYDVRNAKTTRKDLSIVMKPGDIMFQDVGNYINASLANIPTTRDAVQATMDAVQEIDPAVGIVETEKVNFEMQKAARKSTVKLSDIPPVQTRDNMISSSPIQEEYKSEQDRLNFLGMKQPAVDTQSSDTFAYDPDEASQIIAQYQKRNEERDQSMMDAINLIQKLQSEPNYMQGFATKIKVPSINNSFINKDYALPDPNPAESKDDRAEKMFLGAHRKDFQADVSMSFLKERSRTNQSQFTGSTINFNSSSSPGVTQTKENVNMMSADPVPPVLLNNLRTVTDLPKQMPKKKNKKEEEKKEEQKQEDPIAFKVPFDRPPRNVSGASASGGGGPPGAQPPKPPGGSGSNSGRVPGPPKQQPAPSGGGAAGAGAPGGGGGGGGGPPGGPPGGGGGGGDDDKKAEERKKYYAEEQLRKDRAKNAKLVDSADMAVRKYEAALKAKEEFDRTKDKIINMIQGGKMGEMTNQNMDRFQRMKSTDDDGVFRALAETLIEEHGKEMNQVRDRTDQLRTLFNNMDKRSAAETSIYNTSKTKISDLVGEINRKVPAMIDTTVFQNSNNEQQAQIVAQAISKLEVKESNEQKLQKDLFENLKSLNKQSESYLNKFEGFKADRQILLADMRRANIDVQGAPAENADMVTQYQFFRAKKDEVQNQVRDAEMLISYTQEVRKGLDRFIDQSSSSLTEMKRYIIKIRQTLANASYAPLQPLDDLANLRITDPNYVTRFQDLVMAVESGLKAEEVKVQNIQQSKGLFDSMISSVQKLGAMARELKENWDSRVQGFNYGVTRYNDTIADLIPANQRDQYMIQGVANLNTPDEFRAAVDVYNEKLTNLSVRKKTMEDGQDRSSKLLVQMKLLADDYKKVSQREEDLVSNLQNLLGAVQYQGKLNPLQIRDRQGFADERVKIIAARDDAINKTAAFRDELMLTQQEVKLQKERTQEMEKVTRMITDEEHKRRLQVSEYATQEQASILAKKRNDDLNAMLQQLVIGGPRQRAAILQKNAGVMDDQYRKITTIMNNSGSQIFAFIENFAAQTTDEHIGPFFQQSIGLKSLHGKLVQLMGRAYYNSKDLTFPLVAQLADVVYNSIDKNLQQFDEVHIQLSQLDNSDIRDDQDLTFKERIDKQKIKWSEIAEINRENLLIQHRQAIMFDEFADQVHMLQASPSGTETLRNNLSVNGPMSDIAREIQALNLSVNTKLAAFSGGHSHNVKDFKDLNRWASVEFVPKMEMLRNKMQELASDNQAAKAMEQISQLTQRLARATVTNARANARAVARPTREMDAYVGKISELLSHVIFSYGAGLFNGVPTQNLQPGGSLRQEALTLYDNIQHTNLIDVANLKVLVGQTIDTATRMFGADIIREISQKFGPSAQDAIQGVSNQYLGKLLKSQYDPSFKIDENMAYQEPFIQKHLGPLMQSQADKFRANNEAFELYDAIWTDMEEKLQGQGIQMLVPDPLPMTKQQINEKMDAAHKKFFSGGDMPFAGQILGKRAPSIYDGSVPTWSYQAAKDKITRETDPQLVKEYKRRVAVSKDAVQANMDQLQDGAFDVEQLQAIRENRVGLKKDFGVNLVAKVANGAPNNVGQYQGDPARWDLAQVGFYQADMVLYGPQLFALLYSPLQAKMDNLKPMSKNDLLYLQAFKEEYQEAAQNVLDPRFAAKQSALAPDPITRARQNGMLTRAKAAAVQLGEDRVQKADALFAAKIKDLENYGVNYDEAQIIMLDDYDQAIIEQEVKIGGFGHMNQMIQGFSQQMEKLMFDVLQKNGLDSVPRVMQDRQMKMVAQAGQAIRGGQIAPSAYQRQQANPGQATPQFGDMRQYMFQKTAREENPNEGDKAQAEQQKGSLLSEKATKIVSNLKKVSMEDLRFISKLVKDSNGKLMYKEGDRTRQLTDEEKMRAAQILITIVMALMKAYMTDMGETEFQKKKKQLEDKHMKTHTAQDLSQISRLINSIVSKVK